MENCSNRTVSPKQTKQISTATKKYKGGGGKNYIEKNLNMV